MTPKQSHGLWHGLPLANVQRNSVRVCSESSLILNHLGRVKVNQNLEVFQLCVFLVTVFQVIRPFF